MAEYDIIIREGTIVDGARTPRYIGDVAIKDGRIAKIGGLRGATASKVLDASGLIVAPGFIDLHTHYDPQLFWDPYCTLSGWHGVTSVMIGNCGFGFAPCQPDEKHQDRLMLALTRNEAIPFEVMKQGMSWDWVSFPEFMNSVDRLPKGVNVASLVPLTPIYAWVLGYDEAKQRHPNDEELKKMCALVHEGMNAGGSGWSAQVLGANSVQRDYDGTPMVTDLMTLRELVAFAGVLKERGEGCIELGYAGEGEQYMTGGIRQSAKTGFENIAKTAGRPVFFQTVRSNSYNPEDHRQILSWLEECGKQAVPVLGQGEVNNRLGFEITFEDWNLFDDSPAWREVTLGTPAERKAKMETPELRAKLRAEWDSGVHPGEAFIPGSLPGLIIEEVGHSELEHHVGQTVEQMANEKGSHIVDALLDLVIADNLQTEFLCPTGRDNPSYTAEVLNSPYVIAGNSDGGAHVKFQTAAAYSTDMLAWLVRDNEVVSLEDAHYKLSFFPAFVSGMKDRGHIREGAFADIVVYDLENLTLLPSEIAHDLPGGDWRRIQTAEGYRWVMVNGEITFEDGKATGALSGKLLRHGSA